MNRPPSAKNGGRIYFLGKKVLIPKNKGVAENKSVPGFSSVLV
jgi:hypothetical protein